MRLLRARARAAAHATRLLRRPLYAAPGHYLSPLTGPEDVRRAEGWRYRPVAGIDLRAAEQLALVEALDLRPPSGPRWRPNDMFDALDAAVLVGLLRHHRVRRVLEIGSGWSTVAMLDGVPGLEVACVEPHPDRLLRVLGPDHHAVTLLRTPVQDVDLARFQELSEGDVLFIDSTHVVKAGSDVVWLVLHVLPLLRPGVLVHVHDVHWPFEYPRSWLAEGRDWTEAYLIRAFLAHNEAWGIELMTSWVATEHPEALPPELCGVPSGSLWIRRVA